MPPRKKPKFKTVQIAQVPHARMGKHAHIVALVLRELERLAPRAAMKVPLEALGDTKAKVRSALNRALRKVNRTAATAADEKYLYIWNVGPKPRKRPRRENDES